MRVSRAISGAKNSPTLALVLLPSQCCRPQTRMTARGPNRPVVKKGIIMFPLFFFGITRGNMELFPISSGGGQFTFVPLTLWYKFATRGCRWIPYSNCQPSVPTWGVVFFIQSSFKFVRYLVLTSTRNNIFTESSQNWRVHVFCSSRFELPKVDAAAWSACSPGDMTRQVAARGRVLISKRQGVDRPCTHIALF
jgi:hypothetical protein